MTVRELSAEQLEELKQNYVFEMMDNPSWGDLVDAEDIPDKFIFDHYEGVQFFNDDFSCTAGG